MTMSAAKCVSANFVNGIELEIMLEKSLLSKLEEIDIFKINNDLQQEHLFLHKLIKIIAHLPYGLKKLHCVQEYEKKVDAFIVKCRNDIYGTLEDLIKQ
jgi:hypothetical protein